MAAYLMHSLSEYRDLIEKLLRQNDPRCILEIGSEFSTVTSLLCSYAEKESAQVLVADPGVSELAEDLIKRYKGTLTYHKCKSLDVIPFIKEKVDFSLIDGDHNYWTVSNELDLLYKNNPNAWHLVHDIGFPCGDRDQYYDYDSIPREHRHENTDWGIGEGGGVVERGGFCGAGQFTFAKESGGGRNGVCVAVEDFLSRRDDLVLFRLPAVFGLGVIVPAIDAEKVEKIVSPYMLPLLARMEQNRMDLYLHMLRLQNDLDVLKAAFHRIPGGRFIAHLLLRFFS